MRRLLPAIALGTVLALVALLLVYALRPGPDPTALQRADAIATELRCPDCQGLSVADSPTSSAREIRRQIDEMIAEGASDQAVRDHFVARYGEWVLLAPSSPLPWAIPIAVVLAGAGGMAAWLVGRGRGDTAAPAPITQEQRRGLHEEIEAIDA